MIRKLLLSIVIMVSILNIATPYSANNSTILWTEEELNFLKSHHTIRVGIDPVFVPFEFIDNDGEYKGIAADYIKLLSKKTGLNIEIMEKLTWAEAYEKALIGEIDVLPALSKTEEREKFFLFSEPYYYFKRVIVIRDNNSDIKGIEDLEGSTVAVQKNSSHHSYLLSFPQINLSLYETVETALTSVANGTETAFVGNLATTNYLIRSNGLTNLKLVSFEAEKQQAIYFAVRTDWPELISIINKALSTITEEEKISINNKWIGLETDTNYDHIIRLVLLISSIILLIWIISIYWIFRLKNEIEHRKKIQADLETAKKEAEEANNIKSSFLARMSHEIRTPLNAITGMAYLLKKTNVTLTQKMYIGKIIQASNNMLSIINDILDFSKIEAGKVEMEKVSFSIDQVIHDIVSIVSYKIQEQGIEFKFVRDPKIPNWFYGDPKRIEQILLNITNNATKFTTSGEISLDIMLVSQEANYCKLSFTVKDTGIGMCETQVQNLFKPFSQGDASINRRFGGTGLGLSIAKNLIEMMDGDIKVYSTEGEGYTFVIYITLEVDKKKEEEYKRQIYALNFNDIKALVLGETGKDMSIINSYLSAFGISYELVSSEINAINMLVASNDKTIKPYELLIIDYEESIERGFKFIDAIHQNNQILEIPKIIILLPMMREDLFDELDKYGIDMGISKPIIPSILFNGIIDIFRSKVLVTDEVYIEEEKGADEFLKKSFGILIVEDNKTNQLIAKSILKQAGYSVWLADNGKEGVEFFAENNQHINLIMMDLHMPVLNGYEAAVQIRKISTDVPIVAMTADAIQGVKEKCKEHGIYHYISKPFNPEDLVKIISKILETFSHGADELDVLDKSKGLKYLGNNAQLYEMVLNEYFNENQETIERLSNAIEEKRYDDAIQIVHKVKSSSGSIGASRLYNVAAKLQKALLENNINEIKSLHSIFNKLLKKLLDTIK